MRIGIDLSILHVNQRGFDRVIRGMLSGFASLSLLDQFIGFSHKPFAGEACFPGPLQMACPPHAGRRTRLAWRECLLRKMAAERAIDLMHFPANECWLLPSGVKWIVTLHDISYLLHPEWHLASTAMMAYFRWIIRAIARSRAIVVTVSEKSRNDILTCTGLPADRVRTVYPGLTLEPGGDRTDAAAQTDGVEKYLLYVGAIEPRKNLFRMLQAYRKAFAGEKKKVRWIIITNSDAKRRQALMQQIAAMQLEAHVHVKAHVNDRELGGLYRHSCGLLFATLYESFGFPVLEAAARGVPVLISRGSGCAEVIDGHAIMVDPLHVDEIAEGIRELWRGDTDAMVERAYARSRMFSWTQCAQETYGLYHAVITGDIS